MKTGEITSWWNRAGRGIRFRIAGSLILLSLMAVATTSDAFGQGLKITKLRPTGATSATAVGLNKTNKAVGNYGFGRESQRLRVLGR